MSSNNRSAEIYELEDARSRRHPEDLDPANFVAVGPYLEAVRLQVGGSLASISSRIHVKLEYLEAIEAMSLKQLPPKAFAIGFVKSYAEALGLDAAAIVKRFKAEAGYETTAAPAEVEKPAPTAKPMDDGDRPELSFLAVLAVLAFVIWCAFWITRPHDVQEPFNFQAPTDADQAANAAEEAAALAGFTPGPQIAPVLVEATPIERADAIYPPECEAGAGPIESVNVAFTVTAGGGVVSERIVESSNPCFDRAALNALRQWRFAPRTIDGVTKPAFDLRYQFQFPRPA